DHAYTASQQEFTTWTTSQGYIAERPLGYIFKDQEPGTVPLYTLFNIGAVDHYYTTSEFDRYSFAQNGYTYLGIVGYVYRHSEGIEGAIPVYTSYSPAGRDHFYTEQEEEINRSLTVFGYRDKKLAFHIL
ncbi:hypothetical protein M422DRAFT_84633, partial [Sphaerobolus stellatus SS14]